MLQESKQLFVYRCTENDSRDLFGPWDSTEICQIALSFALKLHSLRWTSCRQTHLKPKRSRDFLEKSRSPSSPRLLSITLAAAASKVQAIPQEVCCCQHGFPITGHSASSKDGTDSQPLRFTLTKHHILQQLQSLRPSVSLLIRSKDRILQSRICVLSGKKSLVNALTELQTTLPQRHFCCPT